jgi:hypothetical protein
LFLAKQHGAIFLKNLEPLVCARKRLATSHPDKERAETVIDFIEQQSRPAAAPDVQRRSASREKRQRFPVVERVEPD